METSGEKYLVHMRGWIHSRADETRIDMLSSDFYNHFTSTHGSSLSTTSCEHENLSVCPCPWTLRASSPRVVSEARNILAIEGDLVRDQRE